MSINLIRLFEAILMITRNIYFQDEKFSNCDKLQTGSHRYGKRTIHVRIVDVLLFVQGTSCFMLYLHCTHKIAPT